MVNARHMQATLRSPINKQRTLWCLFALTVIIEFFLFRSYVLRNIATYYPGYFDQADYLLMTYRLDANIHRYGFISGIAHSDMLHTGIFFLIQAVLFLLLFGATRLSALLPNLIYFMALQFAALSAIQSVTTKKYFPLLFFGLILCIQTPYHFAGNIIDFRMDFIAFCLYGIFACLVLQSRLLSDTKWSIAAAMIACLLVLTRCITVVYFTVLFSSILFYLLISLRQYQDNRLIIETRKKQLRNLLLVCFIMSIAVLPYLWLNKEAIYHYYVTTHVISKEKYIRAQEVGITSTLSALFYYPYSLFSAHLGNLVLKNALLISIAYFYLLVYSRRHSLKNQNTHSVSATSIDCWQGFIFLTLCTLAPLVVLTMDISKSPVVGGIAAIPCVLLFFWICLYCDSRLPESKLKHRTLNILATIIFISGLYHQITELHGHNSKLKQRNVTTITQMYQDIGDYAQSNHWAELHISVDQISDYLTSSALATVYFETRHILLHANLQQMGSTMFPISLEDALSSLKNSNVAIFNQDHYPYSVYPYNQAITAIKTQLINYTEQHFKLLGEYHFMDANYRVYVLAA